MAKKSAKSKMCMTCGTLIKKGLISEEGKNFCSMSCSKDFKKQKVCRFC